MTHTVRGAYRTWCYAVDASRIPHDDTCYVSLRDTLVVIFCYNTSVYMIFSIFVIFAAVSVWQPTTLALCHRGNCLIHVFSMGVIVATACVIVATSIATMTQFWIFLILLPTLFLSLDLPEIHTPYTRKS